jgi:antitoxin ParD1/3/4
LLVFNKYEDPEMRTMTVSLSDKQAVRIETAVESGDYASNSEVVRDALRLWEDERQRRSFATERLRVAIEEGLASGPGREINAERLIAEFKARAAARG